MKKILGLILGFSITTGAVAAFISHSETPVSTVAQVLKMKNDAYVTMEGNITKQIRKDEYIFEDKTGSITVEIDPKDWRGVDVTPEDTIRITGELDKGFASTEVEVDKVELIK